MEDIRKMVKERDEAIIYFFENDYSLEKMNEYMKKYNSVETYKEYKSALLKSKILAVCMSATSIVNNEKLKSYQNEAIILSSYIRKIDENFVRQNLHKIKQLILAMVEKSKEEK